MTDLANRKPILCLDFDGVCHSYTSGWKGADVIPDPPVDGLFEFLLDANEMFEVNIFSSRSGQPGGLDAMKKWFAVNLESWWLKKGVTELQMPSSWAEVIDHLLKFPLEKPPAFVGIDDRVLTFTGTWPTVEALKAFKPWNAKGV